MDLVTVIPLTRIPRPEPQTYTYFSSLTLPLGSIVLAPLGRRAVPALVCEVSLFSFAKKTALRQAQFTLKPIGRVLVSWPIVDDATLRFIPAAAEALATSFGLIAKLCLAPGILTRRRLPLPFQWPAQLQKNEAKLNFKIFYGSQRIEAMEKLIAIQLHIPDTQILILTPSVERLNFWQNTLSRFKYITGAYSSSRSASQRLAVTSGSANGSIRLIIGTRGAVFLPIPRLSLIIIDEETSDGHRSRDSQPFYDARDLAALKARLSGAALVAAAAYPSVQSSYVATERTGTPLSTPVHIEQLSQLPERVGEWPIFMPSVETTIGATLAQNKKVIMYLNRRGEAPVVVCRVCGFVPRCPACRLPLARHKNARGNSYFLCHTCGQEHIIPLHCPKCATGEFKILGIGTQTLEARCRALWPNISLWRLDAEMTGERAAIIKQFDGASGPAILVGTATILNYSGRVALAVAPRIDTDALFPSYDAQEQTFLRIGKLMELATKGVIIQTITPKLGVLRLALNHDYNTFYSREIQMRATLGFPPIVNLVKATFTARGPEKANEATHTVAEKIKTALTFWQRQHPGPTEVSILGPLRGYRAFTKGLYRASIILKFQPKERDLQRYLLGLIPGDWRIDINPTNILA